MKKLSQKQKNHNIRKQAKAKKKIQKKKEKLNAMLRDKT